MNADLHSLTGAYALDALTSVECEAFERHLATCSGCRDELEGFQLTTARLGGAAQLRPPTHLRSRLMADVAQSPQERPSAITQLRRPRFTSKTRWLSIAAAVLVVTSGSLGVNAYSNAQRANDLSVTASATAAVLNSADAELVRGEVTGGGSGSLVVSRDREEAVVFTTGLEQPAAGTTYQIWAIGEQGAQSRGLLTPGDGGDAGKVVSWPTEATTFGMTIEPAGGSDQPTTDPVLLLDVPA